MLYASSRPLAPHLALLSGPITRSPHAPQPFRRPRPVVPTLVYAAVGRAIDWLCETFGFAERFRYGPPGQAAGAQLAVGQGSVFLTRPRIRAWASRPSGATGPSFAR